MSRNLKKDVKKILTLGALSTNAKVSLPFVFAQLAFTVDCKRVKWRENHDHVVFFLR